MVFSIKGYSKETRIVKTAKDPNSFSKNNRIYLTPFDSLIEKIGSVEKIKINPNHFETSKSTTIDWEKLALEKVLYTMLKFPEIKIKIESRATSGADVKKAVLSYFQTRAARRYLILQGIDPNRIECADGYNAGSSAKDRVDDIGTKDQESADEPLSDFIIVAN